MEYIRRCWMHARLQPDPMQLHSRHPSRGSAHSRKNSLGHVRSLSATSQRSGRSRSGSQSHSRRSSRADAVLPMHSRGASSGSQILQIETNALMTSDEAALSPPQEGPAFSPSAPSKPAAHRASFWDLKIFGGEGNMPKSPSRSALSPLSPRRRKAMERARLEKRINRLVTSPVPYVVLVLLAVMVVMIFIDVMPISGLICVFAISMVVVVVLGNHYMNKQIWTEEQEGEDEDEGALPPPASHSGVELQRLESGPSRATRQVESEDLGPLTYEDRLDNLNQFFEALFASIDYSLLIIFLGLFVVVENVASTGIPERVWAKIVGDAPFATAASITGISAFVLIVSQFLGNVAVIQLAKPNVEDLDDNTKRLAWAIISFVATIGGNLTITGSAGRNSPRPVPYPSLTLNILWSTSEHHRSGEGGEAGRQHGDRLLPSLPRVLLDHSRELRGRCVHHHRHRHGGQRHRQQLVSGGGATGGVVVGCMPVGEQNYSGGDFHLSLDTSPFIGLGEASSLEHCLKQYPAEYFVWHYFKAGKATDLRQRSPGMSALQNVL